MAASYKPSPLSYGSPRGSPFKRPESPASPSPLRQATPSNSPSKTAYANPSSRHNERTTSSPAVESNTPRAMGQGHPAEASPRRSQPTTSAHTTMGHGNALSQLQPAQVRTLREGFQILDRDSDGIVNRDDVADMLNQLGALFVEEDVALAAQLTAGVAAGLPSTQADVSHFFPPSAAQTMTLAIFLNSLANSLAALSPASELLSALSAFDDDDSGQVDLAELRDALLHTAPEPGETALSAAEVERVMSGFTGRRAFSKAKAGGVVKKGEVFRYQEFVNSISGGGNGGSERGSEEAPDDA